MVKCVLQEYHHDNSVNSIWMGCGEWKESAALRTYEGCKLTTGEGDCELGRLKEMATHSSILAWRSPGTEEPGGLPSMGSHRVVHD